MNTYRILTGDVIEQLRTLPDGCVQCCVTSPPYWGLRDYGVPGQIGLEATPALYVARLVDVFEEVRRVLRDDGTLWLNLGDSYNGSGGAGGDYSTGGLKDGQPRYPGRKVGGLKPKDLVGIPWRVAFGLQDAGWWLRAEIIWAKKAPMPESVQDRPTRSHEQIFLLTKAARYFYDAEAVREPSTGQNGAAANFQRTTKDHLIPGQSAVQHRIDREPTADNGGRNQRDVWLLGPEPYPEAHFATFPTEVPRRAILAGTSERGCCPACGAPWRRVVERSVAFTSGSGRAGNQPVGKNNGQPQTTSGDYDIRMGPSVSTTTTGWQPTCDCGIGHTTACTVLDPFLGSGTTLATAVGLGRDGIGIELNAEYIELARRRIAAVGPLLAMEVINA